ncbi:hypothetical protein HWV07_10495 [Natronomonas salina]|uniref:DUF7544 domain-containing protein n=1 Tax=Natronomonas salina TaxID=1710540 RepID=UPI0015B5E188|nr:hypothetical protein [Natronomonas salina]QLD89435.1 hypothetical protein HWV07_10495 [Natronomonas salina]
MALHALQEIGDAVDLAREFLFPFDLRRWLKLAVVAFFLGGSSAGFPTGQFDTGGAPPDETPGQVPDLPSTLPDDLLLIVAAIVAGLLLLGLVFAVVGAVMEFVFVESLLSGTVSVRRYWSRRWGQGLRLFGFRFVLGLPFLLLVLGWMAILLVPLLLGDDPILPVGFFLLGIPVVFLAGLVYGAVNTFTTVFVVPLMIRDDSGVLAGWRRLWPSVKAEWKQYLGFAVAWLGLTIGTGLVASIAVGIAAVALLIPLGILAAVAYFAVGFSTTAGLLVVGVLAVVFVVAMLVVTALVQVPILTYLRYYALLVLGDIEPEFDLVRSDEVV